MAAIEEMIKNSTCFGVAYDGTVKECKICEVRTKCKAKCETGSGEVPKKPDSVNLADKDEVSQSDEAAAKSAAKEKDKTAKKPVNPAKAKKDVKYADDMPDFKAMSVDELCSLIDERGGNSKEFDKYTAENIKRMRLTMALKKTYDVE